MRRPLLRNHLQVQRPRVHRNTCRTASSNWYVNANVSPRVRSATDMHNHSMNVTLRQARIGDGKSVLPVEHQRAHLYGSLMAFLSQNAPIPASRGMAGEEQESHQASGKLEGSTTHS